MINSGRGCMNNVSCNRCNYAISINENVDRCYCCFRFYCVNCSKNDSSGWYNKKYVCAYCTIYSTITIEYSDEKFKRIQKTATIKYYVNTSVQSIITALIGDIYADDCVFTNVIHLSEIC